MCISGTNDVRAGATHMIDNCFVTKIHYLETVPCITDIKPVYFINM